MTDIVVGDVWEMYSATEDQWVRVVVAKVDGDTATLRYEGVFEFVTVGLSDLHDKPDVFRRAETGKASATQP
jgi:hypothetical protein